MSELSVRRVVTGLDAEGTEAFTDDGTTPNSFAAGPLGVSEVLWNDGSGVVLTGPIDRSTPGFPLEPPPGGFSARVIRMPGIPPGTDADEMWLRIDGDDPEVPGLHATDTLDLMVVLEGAVVLGLADGSERRLDAGDHVIQRGTLHRWRPADHRGWTYLVAMFRPVADDGADAADAADGDDAADGPGARGLRAPATGDSPVRRVVTGEPTVDGGARTAVGGDLSTLTDLWLTGGPLRSVEQGGDLDPEPDGSWSLVPAPGGVAYRLVELSPAMPLIDELWHATPTIDVDVVLSGRVRLDLRGERSTELGPGDVVVQRGTDHRWVALGPEPLRMATVMVATTA